MTEELRNKIIEEVKLYQDAWIIGGQITGTAEVYGVSYTYTMHLRYSRKVAVYRQDEKLFTFFDGNILHFWNQWLCNSNAVAILFVATCIFAILSIILK